MELIYDKLPCAPCVNITALVSAQYLELPGDFLFETEYHRCWEINCIDAGSVTAYVDGRELEVRKGDMTLYAPLSVHGILKRTHDAPSVASFAFESDSPLLYTLADRVIHLPPDLQQTVSEVLRCADLLCENGLQVNRLEPVRQSPHPQRDLILQMMISLLEQLLLRLLLGEPQSAVRPRMTMTENRQELLIRRVEGYVADHLSERLTLSQISRAMGVSVNKLGRDVKAATGLTPQQLIAAQRLKLARQMIRKNEDNVTEIAQKLGFSSLHYFSQWFKKQTRVSPTVYARSIRGRT